MGATAAKVDDNEHPSTGRASQDGSAHNCIIPSVVWDGLGLGYDALARMKAGQSGTVLEIEERHGLTRRLDVLGVRPGKRITKIGSMAMHGPITAQVDGTRVAIGFRMANRVIVKPDNAQDEDPAAG